MTTRPAVPDDDDEWRAVACIGIFTIQMIRAAIVLVRYVDQSPPLPPPPSKEEGAGDASKKSAATSTTGSNGAGEKQPLLVAVKEESAATSSSFTSTPTSSNNDNAFLWTMKIVLTTLWLVAAVLFTTFSAPPLWSNFSHTTTVVLLLEIVLLWTCLSHHQDDDDDGHHTNRNFKDYYDVSQRLFQLALALIVWTVYTTSCFAETKITTLKTPLLYHAILGTLILLSILWQQRYYKRTRATATAARVNNNNAAANATKKTLSMTARWNLVKPYIWPDETTTGGSDDPDQPPSAFWNRVRAISTWGCVVLSKLCNITSPMFLGWATTALAHQDYYHTIFYSISYCLISWLGSTCKELQSLLYMKVAQAAFVQLAATAFIHLHGLSLDWHLRKQLGGVLRSMDRGIAACDTLMTYLFLWLLPAIAECIMVCCIFALYFHYLTLAVAVFYFVFVYAVLTIVLTLWRKQFRKALTTSDNDWHDKVTDSLLNFETVKCFTAEEYELSQFRKAVSRYQAGSVNVQGSLSLLNISQQVILKTCLATALTLATGAIQDRVACCLSSSESGGAGCDSAFDDCCRNTTLCGGMQVGDFVAVLTYTLNLFAPLSFLGSVYNSIIMATIDLGNMSDLLAEQPDVVDAPDALELPRDDNDSNKSNDNNDTAAVASDIAVEFDNVYFHYPTQSADRGLKGLSFKMKRGTTTAIVGPVSVARRRHHRVGCMVLLLPVWSPLACLTNTTHLFRTHTYIQTGAGKTTVSRLLFRFYDVLGGAVKVHGLDVRSVTQRSLRAAIGVVPQTASMFNDTIRSNIWYGNRHATEAELVQAATDAQLLQFIESLDDGWDTMVGDRGLKLSGGERQRAAIARCLLKVTCYFHYMHICVRSPSIHAFTHLSITFLCTSTNH
jgi:ATP-binding cassette, subfamily B, heavy metal transporter